MQLLRILEISLLAGCIGAGLVWYGWGLAENTASVLRARRAPTADPRPEEDDEDVEMDESETEVGAS